MRARYLVDQSALARMRLEPVRQRLASIIAATAELAGLAVLHYDRDYDLIAEITGQNVEWVVPRGSV